MLARWSWEALSLVVMDWCCRWCVCWRHAVIEVRGIGIGLGFGIGNNRGARLALVSEVMEGGGV